MDFISLFVLAVVAVGGIIAGICTGWHIASNTAFLANSRDLLHALRLWGRYLVVLAWNAWRRRQMRKLKRSLDAKCPSCGHRSGRIQARKDLRLLIHTCLICEAQWGEPFLVAPELWVHEAPPGG